LTGEKSACYTGIDKRKLKYVQKGLRIAKPDLKLTRNYSAKKYPVADRKPMNRIKQGYKQLLGQIISASNENK